MGVENLGYVILESTDPAGFAKFAQDVLGFGVTAQSDDNVAYLRMDEAPFRYLIRKSDRDYMGGMGYECASAQDFDMQLQKLKDAGIDVAMGTDSDAKQRAVAAFASFADPSDNIVELFHGRAAGSSFTPGHGIEKFKTGEMGLGHAVLPAPAFDETIRFYEDHLGFGISDDLTLPPFAPEMPDQRIYFMHARNPRHHTLGLYNFPSPTGVIHLMAEVGSLDEVGAAMDRVKQAGLHIFASLGRHSNDNMVSFYFFAPGGIGFEIGYDGAQIEDWSAFQPTKSTSGDIWGHEYDMPTVGE